MNSGKMLKKTKKINQAVLAYLRALDRLHLTIFAAYIKRDYFDNQFAYEKILVNHSRLVFEILQQVRLAAHVEPEKIGIHQFSQADTSSTDEGVVWFEKIISRLEHLYEILFSLDLFKNRMIDHSTFEVCEAELKNISHAISEMIADLSDDVKSSHSSVDRKTLIVPIQVLETMFQNTLQFIMADPMFFVFFIRDLNALNDELMSLQNEFNS
jgi:hypothetical protein